MNIRSTVSVATVLLMSLAAPVGVAAQLGSKAIGCLVQPAQLAMIGSPVMGVIDAIHVQRGEQVVAGQVLASLNSQVERAALRVAQLRAQLTADVLAAEANLALAQQRLKRAMDLEGENYIAGQTLDQLRAEAHVAKQQLLQSRDQQRIREQELSLAQAQLNMRTVRSPFAGIVVERFMEPGERVEERPILKVAQVDPLRVELMVPASSYGSYKQGDRVTVSPELPGAGPMIAKVVRADEILDAASNTFRVQLEMPNPQNRLPAGMRCRVEVPAQQKVVLRAPPPPVAAQLTR